ncbi:MAG: hypothetical protein DIU79_07760 [Actinobacteria bacterium]|jgi:hypothetical protein|nr:MAG: hypothetical protein DIU79_07760 [Actinomycetota bacterium]
MRDGYVARWRGEEYEASPDGDQVRLYRADPADGFDEVRPGRFVRVVPWTAVEELVYVRTTCTWRGQPFIVLGEYDGWLRLEYTGGRAPVAEELGLEAFDFGVYQGWAPAHEVTDLGEQRV